MTKHPMAAPLGDALHHLTRSLFKRAARRRNADELLSVDLPVTSWRIFHRRDIVQRELDLQPTAYCLTYSGRGGATC